MESRIDKDWISRTERFSISENGKVISRAYIRIPGEGGKPLFLFKIKTNKSHIRQGLCRKVIEEVIKSYGTYDIELHPHQTETWGMTIKQLIKFYRGFGFRKKRKGNKWYNTMRRDGRI